MGLFTVLKYGNTNLASSAELELLPSPISEAYYKKVYGKAINESSFPHFALNMLALRWYTGHSTDEEKQEINRKVLSQMFMDALKEYEE